MANIAGVIGGVLQVGDENSPSFSISLVADGGKITEHTNIKTAVAFHSSNTTPLQWPPGITNASLLWVKGTDDSGDPKRFRLTIDTVELPEVTEIIIFNKAPSSKIQAASIINSLASTGTLTLEYVVAG